MISLDDIRALLHISPKEDQGSVVQAARELAKAYLRKKVPFVWNATDLTSMRTGSRKRDWKYVKLYGFARKDGGTSSKLVLCIEYPCVFVYMVIYIG